MSMVQVKDISDREIVGNLRTGQQMEETVKAIYRNYFMVLCHYITQNSGTRQDAEDIFQEVVVNFIELVQKDKFRGESSIKTFLFSMNRHTWLNELKRRGRAGIREEKFEQGREIIEDNVSYQITDRENRATVAALMEAMSESCKKILLLFYYENQPIKEILKKTDYENEQVVRNKKYLCLKQLEQMLNEKPYLNQTLKNLLNG